MNNSCQVGTCKGIQEFIEYLKLLLTWVLVSLVMSNNPAERCSCCYPYWNSSAIQKYCTYLTMLIRYQSNMVCLLVNKKDKILCSIIQNWSNLRLTRHLQYYQVGISFVPNKLKHVHSRFHVCNPVIQISPRMCNPKR